MCLNAELTIGFQNYTKEETDTIVVIGYKLNSGFTAKIDSNIMVKPYAPTDTTPSPDFYTVYPDKDYIVKLPSVNKQFRIADYVVLTQRCACENRKVPVLKSFKVNGADRTDVYSFDLPR